MIRKFILKYFSCEILILYPLHSGNVLRRYIPTISFFFFGISLKLTHPNVINPAKGKLRHAVYAYLNKINCLMRKFLTAAHSNQPYQFKCININVLLNESHQWMLFCYRWLLYYIHSVHTQYHIYVRTYKFLLEFILRKQIYLFLYNGCVLDQRENTLHFNRKTCCDFPHKDKRFLNEAG